MKLSARPAVTLEQAMNELADAAEKLQSDGFVSRFIPMNLDYLKYFPITAAERDMVDVWPVRRNFRLMTKKSGSFMALGRIDLSFEEVVTRKHLKYGFIPTKSHGLRLRPDEQSLSLLKKCTLSRYVTRLSEYTVDERGVLYDTNFYRRNLNLPDVVEDSSGRLAKLLEERRGHRRFTDKTLFSLCSDPNYGGFIGQLWFEDMSLRSILHEYRTNSEILQFIDKPYEQLNQGMRDGYVGHSPLYVTFHNPDDPSKRASVFWSKSLLTLFVGKT